LLVLLTRDWHQDRAKNRTTRGATSNLSSDAINIPIGIPGSLALTIHRNSVHTQDVICKALFAAAHHRSPENQTCALSGRVPIIPAPQPAAAMLALDISGSMLARQCAMCPTRYDILEQAVEIFAQLWSQAGRPNDRLGVTYFRTMIDEPTDRRRAAEFLRIRALRREFCVQSARRFSSLRPNSLRNGRGNLWRPNREFFSKNREFSRQNREFDLGPIF
jgi:hypothetical protein